MACAAAIIPVTIAGLELLRCGCTVAAWILEILTAAAYLSWIFSAGRLK
jgi:hypothetical protein